MLRAARWLARPSLLRGLWRDARLGVRLLREPYVPWWAKLTLPTALLYLFSPVDLLPDFILGVGELDDLLVLYGALKLFINLCPSALAAHHRGAIAARRPFSAAPPTETVIDAEFRRQ